MTQHQGHDFNFAEEGNNFTTNKNTLREPTLIIQNIIWQQCGTAGMAHGTCRHYGLAVAQTGGTHLCWKIIEGVTVVLHYCLY